MSAGFDPVKLTLRGPFSTTGDAGVRVVVDRVSRGRGGVSLTLHGGDLWGALEAKVWLDPEDWAALKVAGDQALAAGAREVKA